MNNYIDITLLPSADIDHYFLWAKVYQQIHLALVEMQNSDKTVPIGVSLPEYNEETMRLGSKLRLFGPNEETLNKFNAKKWLSRLSDYVHITSIRRIPKKISGYCYYIRQQPKTSKERLARRIAKRKGIEIENALELLSEFKEKRVSTPFVNIQSQSSSKKFRLFIQKKKADGAFNNGFSTYGLSSKSSLPEF